MVLFILQRASFSLTGTASLRLSYWVLSTVTVSEFPSPFSLPISPKGFLLFLKGLVGRPLEERPTRGFSSLCSFSLWVCSLKRISWFALSALKGRVGFGENLLGLDGVGTKPPAIEGEILVA